MRQTRIAISKLHRWSGLVLGLLIAISALSGTAMVFQAQLYEWEFGDDIMAFEEKPEPWALPSVWLKNAEERYGPLEHVEGIFGPETTPMRIAAPIIVYDGTTANGGHGHGIIVFDPYTGEPKARFVAEDTNAVWPLWLHNSMFMGGMEIPMLMFLGILTAIFCLSGVFLWLQKPKIKKDDFKLAGFSSPPKVRRSHTTFGIWLCIPLFLMAITGFGLARIDLTMKFVEIFGRADGVVAQENQTNNLTDCVDASADEAWTQALKLNPNSDIKMFFFPMEEGGGYQVFTGPTGTRFPTRGNAEIRMASKCSQLTYVRPAESNKAGDTFFTYMIDFHNGKLFGVVGETLVFILGLIVFLLPATGILAHIWRTIETQKKRRAAKG